VLRIKLRYDDIEVMVQRFATNVGKSGLFLPTKSLQPIGAEIKFELRLANDTPALVGLGRVKAARAPDPHNPKATFGMAIELSRVTPQSRALILRMLDRRRELGLPDTSLPMASDIDAARRAEPVDAAARDPVTGPVPVSGPAPATRSVSADAPGEGLLTSPRRTTGSMAVAKVLSITPLAPEPPRRKRRALSEVIESASGPSAGVAPPGPPGLDVDIDVAAAVARARTLAGGALDTELDALAEAAAVPAEISIEAASAELAKQLGGSAVRRDRSARMDSPPATALATPAVAVPAEAEAEAGVVLALDRDPVPAAGTHPGAAPEVPAGATEPEVVALPAGVVGPAEPAASAAMAKAAGVALAAARIDAEVAAEVDAAVDALFASPAEEVHAEPSERLPRASAAPDDHEVVPEQIADEIHPLDDLDLEDVEHTEMGGIPDAAGAFEPHGDDPAGLAGGTGDNALRGADPLLAARLDAQLAEVEEFDDFEILAEADADDADLLASHGEQDASNSREIYVPLPAGPRRASELDFASRLDLGDDSARYFGEPESEFSAHHVVDRLHDELADHHGRELARSDFQDEESRLPDPHLDSAGHALAAFDVDDEVFGDGRDEPDGELGGELDESDAFVRGRGVQPIFELEQSTSYTLAGIPSDSIDLDPPPVVRGTPPPTLRPVPVEDSELEHALEALDVDLDDLSIPHGALPAEPSLPPISGLRPSKLRPTPAIRPAAEPRPSRREDRAAPGPSRGVRPSGGQPAPGPGRGAAPRAASEDDVVIEFDDDD